VLRGTPAGEIVLEKVTADETIQPGEKVLTSGGDQVFPKGLPVGTVTKVSTGSDLFLNVRVKPAANLSKLEEVLVITKNEEKVPSVAGIGSPRGVDILAQRLPSVPEKASEEPKKQNPASAAVIPPLSPNKAKAQLGGISAKPAESDARAASVHDAAVAGRSGAAGTTKPGNTALRTKPTANSTIKPATEQKPVPLPMKVSEKIAKPAASAPKPVPNQPVENEPKPNQSVPNQSVPNQPSTQPAEPPQDQTAPRQENKPH
jgi:rod shape-determining protein MreC